MAKAPQDSSRDSPRERTVGNDGAASTKLSGAKVLPTLQAGSRVGHGAADLDSKGGFLVSQVAEYFVGSGRVVPGIAR